MTAADIIHQIESLPASEQEEVVRFAIRLGFRRCLTPPELGALASRLAGTEDGVEAAALREEIVQGFYAAPVHAEKSAAPVCHPRSCVFRNAALALTNWNCSPRGSIPNRKFLPTDGSSASPALPSAEKANWYALSLTPEQAPVGTPLP